MPSTKRKYVAKPIIDYGFVYKGKTYDIGRMTGDDIEEALEVIPLMSRSLSVLLGTVTKRIDSVGKDPAAGDKYRDFIIGDIKEAEEQVRKGKTPSKSAIKAEEPAKKA